MDMMDTTARVGAVITTWLSRGGPEGQLLDWLRGYDLPVTGDEEPYLWLARGLEVRGDLTASGGAFCERIKAVLESRPDRGITGSWPERVLYNLYMLCACLHCPICLAEPLLTIYRDRPADRPWRGLVPREALRTALVENQLDTTLHTDWKALLEGRSDYLPGDPEAGFEGILKMHPSREQLDEPVVDAVLDAFEVMIDQIDRERDRTDRMDRLRELIALAGETYPDPVYSWDKRLRRRLEGQQPVKKWAAIVVSAILSDNEIIEAKKAGRSKPKAAQDVPRVASRTEGVRALNKLVGVCDR
jgi:hypothetical protein